MKATEITLLNEIQEQPDCLKEILDCRQSRLKHVSPMSSNRQKIIAIAEGSSRHAVKIATPFVEEWTGLPVIVYNPAMLTEKFNIAELYQDGIEAKLSSIYHQAYFLALSQSGQTTSVLQTLERLRQGYKTYEDDATAELPILTLTNNEDSFLANQFNNHLHIGAGHEKSIAATKSLTASVMSILTWALAMGEELKRLTPETVKSIEQRLYTIPEAMELLFENKLLGDIHKFSKKLKEVNHFILLSKGPIVSVLTECGLKLTETSSNIVYTDNAESFKHGPKVMLRGVNNVSPNSIYIVPTDKRRAEGLFNDIRHHFWMNPFEENEELAFEDDRVFFITFENSPEIPKEIKKGLGITKSRILTLPEATPFQSLFISIVVFQLISYFLALSKGENPDDPTLSKAVV